MASRLLARPSLRLLNRAAPALARAPVARSLAPACHNLLASRSFRASRAVFADEEIPIPELGAESIVEGGILSIAKGVGDYVAAEEMVAEIETGARRPLLFCLLLSKVFCSLNRSLLICSQTR